jgi:hypothetical protein
MLYRSWTGFEVILSRPLSKIDALHRSKIARSRLSKIADLTNAKIIDPISHLCNAEYCPALSKEGIPIYLDDNHLFDQYSATRVRYLDFLFK